MRDTHGSKRGVRFTNRDFCCGGGSEKYDSSSSNRSGSCGAESTTGGWASWDSSGGSMISGS
jgi:hypothetical protein